MARVKATSSDINAKLARGECANFYNGCCQGTTPCTVVNGESCEYFSAYVKPLLEYAEFSGKYTREAKVSVALNPRSKVVRKRRQQAEPKLDLDAQAAPAKGKQHTPQPVKPTLVAAPTPSRQSKVAKANAKQRTVAPKASAPSIAQPQLALEITPSTPKRPGGRRAR